MSLSNIKYLHIIRGFAALFVLFAHAKWPFWIGGSVYFAQSSFNDLSLLQKVGASLAMLSSNGTAMVIVFFVLSGFMITHSYKKNKWQYGQFLINRLLRIYIPYIASLMLAGVLLVVSFKLASAIFIEPIKDYHQNIAVAYNGGLSALNCFKTIFFIRSDFNYFGFNYVYWSLLYEMVFYLLFPIILKYYKQCLLLSIILYPVQFIFNGDEMLYFLVYFFIKYFLFFNTGVWLYQYVSKRKSLPQIFIFKKGVLLSLIFFSFLGLVATGFTLPKGISFLFATLMAILWIVYLLQYSVRMTRLTKAFLFLGEISYSLYLIHVPILLFLYSIFYKFLTISEYRSPWVHFIPAMAMLPIAYAFYQLFERKSFKLIQAHKDNIHKEAPISVNPLASEKVF